MVTKFSLNRVFNCPGQPEGWLRSPEAAMSPILLPPQIPPAPKGQKYELPAGGRCHVGAVTGVSGAGATMMTGGQSPVSVPPHPEPWSR
jgi:hypothetical protein